MPTGDCNVCGAYLIHPEARVSVRAGVRGYAVPDRPGICRACADAPVALDEPAPPPPEVAPDEPAPPPEAPAVDVDAPARPKARAKRS
jgi:hypothetical protein